MILFGSAYARSSPALLVYITCMYTKLVVIVNAIKIVDKSVYLRAFNDLHHVKVAVQVLYRSGMTVGQIFGCVQEARFCTTAPVDIQ